MNFEAKLYRGFVVPGVIAEVILIINLFLPDSISLYGAPLLKHRIGGPKGWFVDMTTTPAILIFELFLLVAGIYAIILLLRSYKRSPKFVPTARKFLVFCDVSFVLMALAMGCFMIIALVWGYLNIFVASVVFLTLCATLGYFIYWTRRVYKHEGLRFWSKPTLKSVATSMGAILLVQVLWYVFLAIIFSGFSS